jgi:hypothetical protein
MCAKNYNIGAPASVDKKFSPWLHLMQVVCLSGSRKERSTETASVKTQPKYSPKFVYTLWTRTKPHLLWAVNCRLFIHKIGQTGSQDNVKLSTHYAAGLTRVCTVLLTLFCTTPCTWFCTIFSLAQHHALGSAARYTWSRTGLWTWSCTTICTWFSTVTRRFRRPEYTHNLVDSYYYRYKFLLGPCLSWLVCSPKCELNT